MDWEIELDEASRYARITTHGTFGNSDYLRLVDEVLSHPNWRPGLPALFDHRDLTMSGVTYDVMRRAGETHLANDDRIGDGKAAILMASAADFGSARQFENLVESQAQARLKVFLDVGQAEAWVES